MHHASKRLILDEVDHFDRIAAGLSPTHPLLSHARMHEDTLRLAAETLALLTVTDCRRTDAAAFHRRTKLAGPSPGR